MRHHLFPAEPRPLKTSEKTTADTAQTTRSGVILAENPCRTPIAQIKKLIEKKVVRAFNHV